MAPTAKKAAASRKSVPVEEMTDEQKVAKSYSVAIQALKDAHLEEFNTLRIAAATELGVTWKPQPTAEQKAEAEIKKLVADNPGLAERYPSLLNFDKGDEDDGSEPEPDPGEDPEPAPPEG